MNYFMHVICLEVGSLFWAFSNEPRKENKFSSMHFRRNFNLFHYYTKFLFSKLFFFFYLVYHQPHKEHKIEVRVTTLFLLLYPIIRVFFKLLRPFYTRTKLHLYLYNIFGTSLHMSKPYIFYIFPSIGVIYNYACMLKFCHLWITRIII